MEDKNVMVRIDNIQKYYGNNHVLKGISLEVKRGNVLAIMGPSGTGKSTLLRCINYLERPTEGDITVGGFTVSGGHPTKKDILTLRRKTAMVFQHYNLFNNKTVLENVMEGLVTGRRIPKKDAKDISLEQLKKVGLTDKLDFYPSQISGGQQQRVGIARALALNPDVILLDEPTSALDPEWIGEVLLTIKKVALEGITMIIVTHELDFARDVASNVIFMCDGLLVEQGPPDSIFGNAKEARTKQFLKRFTLENDYSI